MSSDSIHDAVLGAERRGRTPARSIDAAIIKKPTYGRDSPLANRIYGPHILYGASLWAKSIQRFHNYAYLYRSTFMCVVAAP